MEPEPSRDAAKGKDSDPIAALERWDRRRVFLRKVLGLTVSGALGYATYPWVAGGRHREALAGAKSILRQLFLEDGQGVAPDQAEDIVETHTLPIVLDAKGREYEAFLTQLNLRHIQPMELLRAHFKMRGTVSNELPPPACWKHIEPTLRVADELRERLGVRLLTIASAYRSPAYNAVCPGAAAHSYHTQNMALDLVFDCAPAKVVAAAESLRAEGFYAGGIGRYPSFTHVDTRGKAANWG